MKGGRIISGDGRSTLHHKNTTNTETVWQSDTTLATAGLPDFLAVRGNFVGSCRIDRDPGPCSLGCRFRLAFDLPKRTSAGAVSIRLDLGGLLSLRLQGPHDARDIDYGGLSRSLGSFLFRLEHARLWTAQDFSLGVLQRRPGFSQAGNRQGHTRAFFAVVRSPEILPQPHRRRMRECLNIKHLLHGQSAAWFDSRHSKLRGG